MKIQCNRCKAVQALIVIQSCSQLFFKGNVYSLRWTIVVDNDMNCMETWHSASVKYGYIGRVTCRVAAQIGHIRCTTVQKYCIFFLLWGLNCSVWVTVTLCFQPWIFIFYCLWFCKTICNSLLQIKISFLWHVVCVYTYVYVSSTQSI